MLLTEQDAYSGCLWSLHSQSTHGSYTQHEKQTKQIEVMSKQMLKPEHQIKWKPEPNMLES